MAIASSGEASAFRPRATLDRPATIGRLAASLDGGVSGRFDRSRTLEVDLFFGSFAAATELSVLNGENRLALRSRSGVWEVIGFAGAEEISAGRWRLSTLLRGLAGTEDAMAAGADASAAVVLLDVAVRPLGLTTEETGLSLDYIAEPIGMAATPATLGPFAGGVRAQTPLSPVHLGARRMAGGDVQFSWIRRSRLDGDSWVPAEVPLDEAVEAYRLEILDGAVVRRAVEVGEARFVYPQALELLDFGGLQASIRVRVRQVGRVAEGIASEAQLVVG